MARGIGGVVLLVRQAVRVSASLLALSAGSWAGAEPTPTIAPPSSWVRETPAPPSDAANKDLPVQVLLSSLQQRIGPDGAETYLHTVAIPQTTAGLQAVGTIAIPWNSERSDLTIHHALIRRGQQSVDLLKGQELVVLRRENNLESSTLDGVRTVALQAAGLEIGDQVDLAFSYRDRSGTIGIKPESITIVSEQAPIGILERRYLIADGAKVEWRADSSLSEIKTSKKAGQTELDFVRRKYVPASWATNVPARYKFPAIQLTSYSSWADVAQVMLPLYDKARKPEPASPLVAMADDIAKTHATPEARMLAALRLTQDKVRYVALQLGESAFIPSTADQTWSRRFGDCKGKTAMLLALLDRLGIAADPVLTSTEESSLLGGRLPSLYAFNHVVVRARLNGRDFVLDPTSYGQRTLEELSSPGYEWGLPIVAGAQLWKVPEALPTRPLSESEIVWDASKGFDQQVPFTATLTYRGSMAAMLRALQAAAPDRTTIEKYLKDSVPVIDSDLIAISAIEPEGSQGEYVVRLTGKSPMRWSRDVAGREYAFSNDVPDWDAEFDRSDGPSKELPVQLAANVWLRSSEIVVLPRGGAGFSVKGRPIDSTVAGTEIKRSARIIGDRAVVTADFRRLTDEITASEARAAEPVIKRIATDYAYVVAPKDYVITQAEVKAIVSEEADNYSSYLRRARLLMDQSDRRRANAELDKAIEKDSTRPEAPALKSVNYFYLGRYDEARSALNKAQNIQSDEPDVLRAQALLAWYDQDAALALKAVNRALELDPEFYGLYSIRAKIRAGTGNYDEALVDVRRAVEMSADTIGPSLIAQYEAASGRLDQAIATIDKAVASGRRDDPYLMVLKGDLLFAQGKKEEAKVAYRSAKADMRAAMEKDFRDATGKDALPVSSDLELNLLFSSRNYDEAEPLADRKIANQRYPSASNLGKRAMVRVMNGKYEGAITDARSALSLDPSDPIARVALVLALLRTEKFAEAEIQATKALAENKGNASLHFARAIARARLGKAADAAKDLQSARQLRFDIALDPAFMGLKTD
jgi:tetratricopeptide (TPR) repeat protein/transglutaminase-like putative cysteine protease